MNSSPHRWTRTDGVVLRVVILIAIGLAGLAMVYRLLWISALLPADRNASSITVHRPGDITAPSLDATTSGDGISVSAPDTMVITFHDPDTTQRLLLSVPGLMTLLAISIVLVSLLRVAASLNRGDPFVPSNARHVYTVAITVLAAALLVPAAETFTHAQLQSMALDSHEIVLLAFTLDAGSAPGVLVLTGVVLVALAEVFRRGTRLRDDVAGLV